MYSTRAMLVHVGKYSTQAMLVHVGNIVELDLTDLRSYICKTILRVKNNNSTYQQLDRHTVTIPETASQ